MNEEAHIPTSELLNCYLRFTLLATSTPKELVTPGSDEEAFLNWSKANASAGYSPNNPNPNNKDSIILRPEAYKIEISEEFLHGTQAKIGMNVSTSNITYLETHVKDFMIRHKNLLGLSNKDVQALTIMKESYQR